MRGGGATGNPGWGGEPETETDKTGKRKTENGERKTENGKRRTKTENGKRRTENGKRKTEIEEIEEIAWRGE
jgi:hypothetical protein